MSKHSTAIRRDQVTETVTDNHSNATQEAIAERAYYLWLERSQNGGGEGSPDSDWYQAEKDLTE